MAWSSVLDSSIGRRSMSVGDGVGVFRSADPFVPFRLGNALGIPIADTSAIAIFFLKISEIRDMFISERIVHIRGCRFIHPTKDFFNDFRLYIFR